MAYLIVRTDGAFVNRPGSASSYTRDFLKAQRFNTRESAENSRCPENESVVNEWDYIPSGR